MVVLWIAFVLAAFIAFAVIAVVKPGLDVWADED